MIRGLTPRVGPLFWPGEAGVLVHKLYPQPIGEAGYGFVRRWFYGEAGGRRARLVAALVLGLVGCGPSGRWTTRHVLVSKLYRRASFVSDASPPPRLAEACRVRCAESVPIFDQSVEDQAQRVSFQAGRHRIPVVTRHWQMLRMVMR